MEKKSLNVGCGDRVFKEYPQGHECINVDSRDLPGVDKVCDVRKLPFADEEFDFILASDIVEHFPVAWVNAVINEWVRVLKNNGLIEFRLPNLAAICQHYVNTKNAKHVSWMLYGGQEYAGNFHYTGYDREFFAQTCKKSHLYEESYKEEGTNMIVIMRKVKNA